jgi:tRNA-specific 2-thiouridylase
MQNKKHSVFVGLSGGVDSAVSAALLLRDGYDVTGVFIKIWQPEFTECTWREDRLDAMRVAAYLQIPFREIDLSDEYKDEVVHDMIAAYESGVTPNPDVLCNERIKFGHFLRYALSHGADYVATGHYAQKEFSETTGTYSLLRSADQQKDQSYFLYRLGQAELSRALFPVGGLTKPRVRELAETFGLPVARKHDSQGLCFVGPVTIPEFLSKYISLKSGAVLDRTGAVVGEHDGAALYTIGQRHGFRLHNAPAAPMYVTAIHVADNVIEVAADLSSAAVHRIDLDALHWINEAREGDVLHVQTRYRERPVTATVTGSTLVFTEPHVISPGQSVVLYQGARERDECYGGGIAIGINTSA